MAARVDVLRYSFVADDEGEDYSAATAWEGELAGFRCRLADKVLEARPLRSFPDADTAREALEPRLHQWEVWSELQEQRRFRFRFSSAEVVDQQAESRVVSGTATLAIGFRATATGVVRRASYPAPPTMALAVSPLVEELLRWVRDLRAGRQRMLVLAYLCYTLLTYEFHGESEAAKAINVARNVLGTLSRLAHKNDPAERRKVLGRQPDPLTAMERTWILAAIPAITRQAALAAAGAPSAQLTMADLPSL
jgi:hypothetical protein